MVRSEKFNIHQIIGHPISHIERLTQWNVDELIILDISDRPNTFEINRDDHKFKGALNLLEFISNIARTCAVPLTLGGHIRTLDDIRVRIQHGADKVSVNTAFFKTPDVIESAAQIFGSQALIACIDYRLVDDSPTVFINKGLEKIDGRLVDWAKKAEELGCGEIFLHAIERDGTAQGYDLKTIHAVTESVTIPVIACGGAGHQSHFKKCFESSNASAIAAGNIFHFTENAYPRAKSYLRNHIKDIR
jgi:imidazole glycerol-phosphate synthase subunit HisF